MLFSIPELGLVRCYTAAIRAIVDYILTANPTATVDEAQELADDAMQFLNDAICEACFDEYNIDYESGELLYEEMLDAADRIVFDVMERIEWELA